VGGTALKSAAAQQGIQRTLVLLGALLLAAWFAQRWSDTPTDPETGAAAVVDADSAWRLRRTALALSTSRLAQVDGFASFPDSIACVDLPLFDELLAALARLLAGEGVSPGPGVVDDPRLSAFAARVGPGLMLLTLVALYGLLRRSLGASRLAALGALLVIASAPVVVEAARPGTVRLELFVTLLLVLQLRAVAAVGRAGQDLDRFTWAMVAGGATGIGLASSPLFLLPAVATWSAFLLLAQRSAPELRANVVRAGLLYSLPAVVIGLLPILGGPWVPAQHGPVAAWTDLLCEGALVGAAPLLAMLWRPRWSWHGRPVAGLLWLAGAFVGLALLVLLDLGPEHEKGALLAAALGWDAAGPRFSARLWSGPVLLWSAAFLIASPGRLREVQAATWASIPVLALELGGLLALGAACLRPEAALLLAVPAAAALTRWFDASLRRRYVLALVPVALLWGALDPARRTWEVEREEGLAAISAARWLRKESEAPGPWSSVQAGARWGVLCDERLAPLIAWHARRPCAAPGPRSNGDARARERLRQILAASAEPTVASSWRSAGLRYVLLGPESFPRLIRQGVPVEALRSLAEREGGTLPAGLQRVWSEVPGKPAAGLVLLEIASD
jgi:hypothetical protein